MSMPSAYLDPIALNQLTATVNSAIKSRAELVSQLNDPRRNIDDECGYPNTTTIDAKAYHDMYERDAVAARVVQVFPKESWQSPPEIYEDENAETETAFEAAWKDIGKNLRGQSWHKTSEGEGNLIWEYLLRIDTMSGIGRYGVMLLGIDDGKPLNEPIDSINERGDMKGNPAPRKLVYLRCFDEYLAPISRLETDPTNPRYGQPVSYLITFSDPNAASGNLAGTDLSTKEVHWTRVLHVADNLGSSEVYGVQRMLTVWNRLQDLRKLYGGSAEMYWRGAFPGISIETHPQLGGDVVVNEDTLRDAMENYMNGLQRYLSLMGMSAKSLAPQVVDPTPQILVQIEAICILLGIPKRVFMGSERGELASSQDDGAWNDRLRARQNLYLTPRLVVPFIDRLIKIGVLPQPEEFSVVWPNLNALTPTEQATIAQLRADALTKYIAGNIEALIPPVDFLVREMGYTQEEALSILGSEDYSVTDARAEQAKTMMDATQPPEPAQSQSNFKQE